MLAVRSLMYGGDALWGLDYAGSSTQVRHCNVLAG